MYLQRVSYENPKFNYKKSKILQVKAPRKTNQKYLIKMCRHVLIAATLFVVLLLATADQDEDIPHNE